MALSDVVLKSSGLTVGFGQMRAVVDLDVKVRSGEVVALLGANGAGKTTTLLGLARVLAPMKGHVELFGERTKAPLQRRARRGLALVSEQRSIFRRITAAANATTIATARWSPSASPENSSSKRSATPFHAPTGYQRRAMSTRRSAH